MDTPVERELMRRDVHPAEVLLADGTLHRDVRVYVTSRRLIAYHATPGRRIEPVLDVELASAPQANRGSLPGTLVLELADGTVAHVNRGRGCGCGSPLKALGTPVGWR